MIIPIRCFTCNKILANKSEIFKKMREDNINIQEIWTVLDINKDCCKSILLSTVDALDIVLNTNVNSLRKEVSNARISINNNANENVIFYKVFI